VHVCVQLSYLGGGGWRGWLSCCIFAARRCLTHCWRSDNRIHLSPPFAYTNTTSCCSLRFALCLPVSAHSRQLAFAADVGMNVQPQQSVVSCMSTVKVQVKREHQRNVYLFPLQSTKKQTDRNYDESQTCCSKIWANGSN